MCLGHILMKTETSKWGPLSFYGLRLLWLCLACWRDGYDYSGIYFHIVSWWCMVYQSANSTCYWALCSLFKLGIQSNFRTVAFWKIFRLHNILLFKIFFSFQPCMMKISEFHFHQKVLISSIYQYNYVKDIYQYIYCFYTFHHTITLKICTDIHIWTYSN